MWNHSLASLCSPEALATPSVFGAEILSLSASWVTNYTFDVPAVFNYNHGNVYLDNVNFCNVTITYTHPGHDDLITVETWLPQRWNKRLQATGGGGWNAGRFVLSEFFMPGAIGEGYAATSTDAGLGEDSSPNSWVLESPGNVDLYNVQNLGYVSLNDQAIIGKSLVQSFYKQNASYSYWSGCSQGGRQGLMLAQRYPHAYDGIAASAPALAWTELAASVYYPLLVKLWAGTANSPLNCEMEFITDEAIAACDSDDGIVDGIISNPSACHFDALAVVNKSFNCSSTGKIMKLTKTAALVANAAWSGPQAVSGKPLWFGYNRGADISSLGEAPGTIANASASTASDIWFRLFVAKDKDFQSAKLTPLEYERFFHRGVLEYAGLMNADSHDLREFKNAGGKLISYHGLADNSIPTKSSEHYHRMVSDAMGDVSDFYRYFESPGLGHCSGGQGGQPLTIFNALRRWVENDTVPDHLPVEVTTSNGTQQTRFLCPYPKVPFHKNGNVSDLSDLECVSQGTLNAMISP